jgi:hypothetical protein
VNDPQGPTTRRSPWSDSLSADVTEAVTLVVPSAVLQAICPRAALPASPWIGEGSAEEAAAPETDQQGFPRSGLS